MARYKVTFDVPLRLAARERAMAIAGRLDERLLCHAGPRGDRPGGSDLPDPARSAEGRHCRDDHPGSECG